MNKNIRDLLDRDISRKEFLQFIGGGIVVLLGIQNLISYLSQYDSTNPKANSHDASRGFGSSKFGV